MLENRTHNLMIRLIQEKRSLSRIKINYIKHAGTNEDHQKFLKQLEKNKEEHIRGLEELLGKTPVLNLDIAPQENLRVQLKNQGTQEKGIETLSKWYNVSL